MKRMLQTMMAALAVLVVTVSCKSDAENDPFHGLLGSWEATMVAGVEKVTYDVRQPEVVFQSDGFVYGYTGLNNFNSRFKIDQDKNLIINELISTKKGGTDAVAAFERTFETALKNTVRFGVSGEILTFYGVDGNPVMKLKKKAPKAQ